VSFCFCFSCVIVALRGAATLKARALKEVWNIAAVIPVERSLGASGGNGNGSSHSSFSGELLPEDNFSGTLYSRELLARGCELLKRTRKGIFLIVCLVVCSRNILI